MANPVAQLILFLFSTKIIDIITHYFNGCQFFSAVLYYFEKYSLEYHKICPKIWALIHTFLTGLVNLAK